MFNFFRFLLVCLPFSLAGQQLWTPTPVGEISNNQIWIKPDIGLCYTLNVNDLKAILNTASTERTPILATPTVDISLPTPSGKMETFEVWESSSMEPALQAKFPEIRTYTGYRKGFKGQPIKLDITPQGFHAFAFLDEGIMFIDPAYKNNNTIYYTYWKKDYGNALKPRINESELKQGKATVIPELKEDKSIKLSQNGKSEAIGQTLRRYRIAVATSGEYTQFHGGTVAQGLAAVTTSINRVNGVYEKELCVRLVLIANNNLIIYTNPSTDPYSNNNANALLTQNQSNLNSVIGSANYDIGHVMNTGGGGLATLGCVCLNSQKAQGQTGSPQPVGDPYDIDYVAHEIGHQFGGNHTFNGTQISCGGGNRNAGTAYEPGSGSTIMAYAGICGSDDIQNNSDAYFHNISYREIFTYTNNGAGNSCAVQLATGNNAPTVNAGVGGLTIPARTPFRMKALSAADPDNDTIYYCWEQFDLGPGGAPNSPTGNAPWYRSFNFTKNPERVFPRWSNILANTTSLGEISPNQSRTLNFRCTVRDNKAGGGGVDHDTTRIFVTNTAGPFQITSQNSQSNFVGGNNITVTWNVANTDIMPVNCGTVNILLSDDTSKTYSYLLASAVPNNGTAQVTLPVTVNSTRCRIMVEGNNHIFFDVNNSWITVTPPPIPTYFLNTNKSNGIKMCQTDSSTFKLSTLMINGLTDQVKVAFTNLPSTVTAVFDKDTLGVNDTTEVHVYTNAANAGTINLSLQGTSLGTGAIVKTINLNLTVVSGSSLIVNATSPLNNATTSNLRPVLRWTNQPDAAEYKYIVALDSQLTNIVDSGTVVTNFANVNTFLNSNQKYWWGVKANSPCGQGSFLWANAFNTPIWECDQDVSTLSTTFGDTAVYETAFVISTNNSAYTKHIALSLNITHPNLSEVDITLISPDGRSAIVFSAPQCSNLSGRFTLNITQDSIAQLSGCIYDSMSYYLPINLFSSNLYNGKVAGQWRLRINDRVKNNSVIALNNLSLSVCGELCNATNTITITQQPTNQSICTSGSALLNTNANSGNLYTSYEWYKNNSIVPAAKTRTYLISNAKASDSAFYYAVASNGCAEAFTDTVLIAVFQIPQQPTITQVGNDLVSSATVGNQWYLNNVVIPGATSQVFTPTQNGNYAVNQTVNNCSSPRSQDFQFVLYASNLVVNAGFIIYPNPSKGEIVVSTSGNLTNYPILNIYDVQGKIVHAQQLNILNEGQNQTITTSLPSGVYTLKIVSNKQAYVNKLVIE